MLVAGEHPCGLAVVSVKQREHLERDGAVGGVAGLAGPDAIRLQGHRDVDAVRRLVALDAVDLVPVRKRLELGAPVVPLLLDGGAEVEEPRLASPLVQPVDAQQQVGPAVAAPRSQWALGEDGVELAEEACHCRQDAGVAGRLVVLAERFQDDEQGPGIVG